MPLSNKACPVAGFTQLLIGYVREVFFDHFPVPSQPFTYERSRHGSEAVASNVCLCVITQRSEEHTSELQSLMRISYAVFCLKKKTKTTQDIQRVTHHQQLSMNEYRSIQHSRDNSTHN